MEVLRQFLDDSTKCITKKYDEMSEGPRAAFTFPKITVRDFAAMQLGSLLKISDEVGYR